MEGDKEAYLEEASKALRRQRKTISDLESEKQQLARSINVSRLDAGPVLPNLLEFWALVVKLPLLGLKT